LKLVHQIGHCYENIETTQEMRIYKTKLYSTTTWKKKRLEIDKDRRLIFSINNIIWKKQSNIKDPTS
jgi:hypothetical protein